MFTRGFQAVNRLLWPRRWWLMILPSLLIGILFFFLPDSSDSAAGIKDSLQARLLLASFMASMAALLVAFFICLAHSITHRHIKWVAGLVLFFPLTAIPYLYFHQAIRD